MNAILSVPLFARFSTSASTVGKRWCYLGDPVQRQCGSDGLFLASARPARIAYVRREHHISLTR